MLKLKRLNIEDEEAITNVFTGVFTKEPWNDDWSDEEQLDMYITDLIGQGYSCEEACKEVKMVVEGVNSAKAAGALAQTHGIEMPIVSVVNRVLFEGMDPREAVEELMLRDRKAES